MVINMNKTWINTCRKILRKLCKLVSLVIICISGVFIYYIAKSDESMTNKIQSITNIFVIISVLFAAYQAYLYKKDYRVKNEKDEAEKAIKLAEIYVNEIINNISYLNVVYKMLGISKIISYINTTKMKQFDKYELDELLTEEQQQEIEKKLTDIDTEILISARQTFIKNKDINIMEKISQIAVPDENQVPKEIVKIVLNNEFISIKSETLNKLEYICMYFNTKVANSKVVYQSLHQTFLKSIKLLYYDMAKININIKDKYYTNIIKLFNEWNMMYLQAHAKEIESKRSQTINEVTIET